MTVAAPPSDPLMLFIAQAAVIIACSQLIGFFTRRFRQPMVIAEVLAGIALGPSLFGIVMPAARAALFPEGSLPALQLFSQIGLIFFMFIIGFQIDPALLRRRSQSPFLISIFSIALPFGLGALIALFLYPIVGNARVAVGPFALFVGIAMSITAFPVLARILTERQMQRSEVGQLAIATAAIGDVVVWCILAFVVSIARASGATTAMWTTVMVVTYGAVMLFVIRPFLERIGPRIAISSGPRQNVTAVIFLLLLASAWLTELIGVHALFGAFLLGAILPREGNYVQALVARLEDVATMFFLPLFFAYSGLRTEIGLLASINDWEICALIIAFACIGKFGGSVIVARVIGLEWREASAIGILMNTRGLIELIVLNIGLDLGVISPVLFTMLVIMALATTLMTTPLLNWMYPFQESEHVNGLEPSANNALLQPLGEYDKAFVSVCDESLFQGRIPD